MKHSHKFRLFCTLLVSILLLASLTSCNPGVTGSASDFSPKLRTPTEEMGFSDGFGYVVYDDGTLIISDGAAASGNVVIPEQINGRTVVGISEAAFYQNTAITSVTFPSTLEYIGIYAFAECSNLTTVVANDKLWEVAGYAFDSTPWLESQTDEFVIIGDNVLVAYNGNDPAPVIPDNVKHIGAAFAENMNITGVTFNKNVLSISEYGFAGCESLNYIELGESLVYVGLYAFSNANELKSVIFPDSLLYLRDEAFLNCYKLKYVYLGNSLVYLGDKAFNYCQGLRAAYLPKTLDSIKTSHFTDCASITLLLYGGSEAEFSAVATNDTINSFRDLAIVYDHKGGIE